MVGMFMFWNACSSRKIAFIPTEPVSLPTAEALPYSFCLSVSDVKDTMHIVSRYAVVHDVRRTTAFALEKAFEASFPLVRTDGANNCLMLRVVSVAVDYRPVEHYQHRRSDGSSSTQQVFLVDVAYKALLYNADTLIAVFDNVVSHTELNTFRKNLKRGMELMAEDLNAKVVRFMLGQKDE
ncbi:MAG TPA: hypothetical protein PKD45_00205 [Flavobacteriales bacterium]|nr:hypothetical protein [Flavobacteriales bacterium]